MSGVDERLEQALHESASPAGIETSHVFAAVTHKRRRRQLRRRALAGGLAATVVLGAVATGVIVTRHEGDDLRVATPATSGPTSTIPPLPTVASAPADTEAARTEIEKAMPAFQVEDVEWASEVSAVATVRDQGGQTTTVLMEATIDGGWQPSPTPRAFVHDGVLPALGTPAFGGQPFAPQQLFPGDDMGYVQGPLASADDEVGVTTDAPGATGSTLVRIGCDCGITFEGQLLWLTPGADVWWAVTRDYQIDTDGTEYRLKRIVHDRVESHPIPAGEVPAGPPASDGTAVWVPTRDGVLRFDAASGELARAYRLPTAADTRGIALIQGEVVLTDGSRLVRADGSVMFDTGSDAPLLDLAVRNNAVWAVSATEAFGFTAHLADLEVTHDLAPGLTDVSVQATDDVVAVSGLADLGTGVDGQVVVLIGNDGSARTVVIAGGADPAAAVVSDELVFTSDGRLFSVAIG